MAQKKEGLLFEVYLLVFGLVCGLLLVSPFVAPTGFIGSPQQTTSHGSQSHVPHGSSTEITSPHSPHSYLSPFLFAKN